MHKKVEAKVKKTLKKPKGAPVLKAAGKMLKKAVVAPVKKMTLAKGKMFKKLNK